MTSELIDLLDRQASFARRQTDPAEFLLGVVRFIAYLRSDPRLESHVEDIERDGTVWSEAQLAHENDVIPELMRLRDILVQLAPELDDSAMPEPAFEQDDSAWDFSFALFDRLDG